MKCSIHQPNLFPRMTTLLKIFLSDRWISLSHVQFTRRDYQNRFKISDRVDVRTTRWHSVAVHRQRGRDTTIAELEVIDPQAAAHKLFDTLKYHYGPSIGWNEASLVIEEVADLLSKGDLVHAAEMSGYRFLKLAGWEGSVFPDVALDLDKSERLAFLAKREGCNVYLSGPGGSSYLDSSIFNQEGISIRHLQLRRFAEYLGGPDQYQQSSVDFICRNGIEAFRKVFDYGSLLLHDDLS